MAEFTAAQRERAEQRGQAMPGGRFPIRNRADLLNAIRAVGRARPPRPGVGPGAAHPRHVEVGRNPEGGVMADATFADQAAATAAEDAEAEAILADAVSRDDDDDPEGADQLGDPGKRALQRMKEELKRERARRKEAERRAAEAAKK